MKKIEKVKEDPKATFDSSFSRILSIALPAVYVVALTIFCLIYSVIPGPEFLALCFFIYAAYNKRSHRFIKDWFPFIAIFLSYEAMFSLVGIMPHIVHVVEPINVELELFGSIPTLDLQHLLTSPLLDYVSAIFYSLHFIAPTVFGFALWRLNPKHYWKYTISLAVCTYSALVTFLIYPVAPPWYGLSPSNPLWNGAYASRVLFSVGDVLGVPVYRAVFDFIEPNQFAAFPSLHSALPWLITLFALKVWKAKALPILVFPLGVWFSVVFLGEHYVIDVLGGIAYATVAFVVAVKVVPYVQSRHWNLSLRRVSESNSKNLGETSNF
jgi:hypothetical protein